MLSLGAGSRGGGPPKVANRPGLAGTVPELPAAVPCPEFTRICAGIVCYCQLALITSSQLHDSMRQPSSCCVTCTWRMCRFCRYIHRMNRPMPESLFFIFFYSEWLQGFGALFCVLARIVRLIQAEPDASRTVFTDASTRESRLESLLVGDAGKTPAWQMATKNKK